MRRRSRCGEYGEPQYAHTPRVHGVCVWGGHNNLHGAQPSCGLIPPPRAHAGRKARGKCTCPRLAFDTCNQSNTHGTPRDVDVSTRSIEREGGGRPFCYRTKLQTPTKVSIERKHGQLVQLLAEVGLRKPCGVRGGRQVAQISHMRRGTERGARKRERPTVGDNNKENEKKKTK